MLYPCNGRLFIQRKQRNSNTCCSVDSTEIHWQKSNTSILRLDRSTCIWNIKRHRNKKHTSVYFYYFKFVCTCTYTHMSVDAYKHQKYQITWSWNYRLFLAVWWQYWESNWTGPLKDQYIFLTMEPSLKHHTLGIWWGPGMLRQRGNGKWLLIQHFLCGDENAFVLHFLT